MYGVACVGRRNAAVDLAVHEDWPNLEHIARFDQTRIVGDSAQVNR